MSGLLNSLKSLAGTSRQTGRESEGGMRFTVSPSPKGGANGWAEWLKAMKLVARLPAGIPQEFRRKLWLTLAEQHLQGRGIDWAKAEKSCFSEWTNPDDDELGVQIVKDLHRTGCSLFCGSEGRENQALLKRVLLAYARWNKAVGYCQGFNMLAALILEVMDKSETDSLKVMIYLIEAVLPEGYFANNLRGLSVDMAVFRDLLRLRLPRLSNHLEKLQKGAAEGSCYEPPLTNVFTMQWFLTLFCNCLPRNTVLRVWDLIFLEGDEVLLTTALAIWENLQDRILSVDSADEFYSVMGELARDTLEAPPEKSEELVARAVKMGPVPELPKLRDKHRYNITPWAHSVQTAAKKGLRLFYSEDENDSSDEGDKLALTTAYGLQAGSMNTRGRSALVAAGVFGHPDRERLALDISSLKQQYARLRERQRQAHIILAAACARQPHVGVPTNSVPMSMNHLLLGKSAIVSARGRRLGPPQGSIPPTRVTKSSKPKTPTPTKTETIQWKDADCRKNDARRDSLKWKDIKQDFTRSEDDEDLDDDNKLVSESEANEIAQGSLKTRRKSESSSYSEGSESSTSTSLCDEQNRMSDFDSEPASISDMTNLIDVSDSSPTKEFLDGNTSQIPITSEAGAAEIGSCVQEFKDFLDKKNNMENGRGLICVLPDLEINNEENDKSSIQEDITSNQEEETHRTIDTFDDFVDSNRGKTLRNYLDEFRKADIAKSEVTWDTTKPLHVDIHDVSVMSETHDTYSPSILSDILNLDETNKTSENFDEPDRKSIGSTSDNRPDSCDRSISSSISSISPVLKNSPAYIDEKMTYSCYKSPLRTDSGLAIELAQDEKPLEFKIDKYFEHSPEFFGARKYGSYLSSDDEEERREVAELSKRRYQSPAAMYITRPTETKKTTHWSENEIREEPIDPDIKNAEQGSRYSIDLSPNQHEMEKFKCDVKDTYELYRVTSKYIPKDTTSPPTSAESTHSLTDLINKFKNKADSFDNSSTDDTKKHSLLGKTKSEELTVDQKRAFSIIDDDIEEIRIQSGRRNSERALKIIQENSKILNRILVNQGNKSNNKNTLVEESIQEDFSKENRFRLRLSEGSQKSLPSPRSSSLDDYVPPKTEYYSQRSLDFSINYPDRDTALKTQLKAVDPIMKTSLLSPVFSPAEDKKYSGLGTSSMYTKDSPQDKGTSELHPKFFRVSETTALHSTQTILDENKTDMFGWENKGFDVNQHLPSSVEKITPISPSTEKISYDFHLENIVHDSLVFEKPKSPLRLELSLPKQESDDSWYKRYRTSESPDKNSTLTAVSETVLEPIESSTKETGESWKLESYTRYSDSYNISSPTKLKSNETSYGIDSSLRNIKKFGDSPISRLTDSFSKISECSPVENAPLKSETNKFETSQSSDLCVMSSSMSFSFDPSNEEHTSTKPGTFNSSDTLCQLTSLDQVSTPISPKVINYTLGKESTGVSQRELALELDKYRFPSDEPSFQGSYGDTESMGGISSLKTPTSPVSNQDKSKSNKSPDKVFNPFPRSSARQPKELGLRLGLYKDPTKSPAK